MDDLRYHVTCIEPLGLRLGADVEIVVTDPAMPTLMMRLLGASSVTVMPNILRDDDVCGIFACVMI